MGQLPYTPAILVDETILDANITAMAKFAASHDLQLRPHAKTHKMAPVANKQTSRRQYWPPEANLGEAQYFRRRHH